MLSLSLFEEGGSCETFTTPLKPVISCRPSRGRARRGADAEKGRRRGKEREEREGEEKDGISNVFRQGLGCGRSRRRREEKKKGLWLLGPVWLSSFRPWALGDVGVCCEGFGV